uniref:Uncharacterized protein n=1 Tax=Anguilla anguilla TaxID=7936 RepID=A0A0E9Q0Y7_ANGAN
MLVACKRLKATRTFSLKVSKICAIQCTIYSNSFTITCRCLGK